ncbi:MAG: hypothetical protein ACYDGY_06730 [Acidimicrobiales bacterium]
MLGRDRVAGWPGGRAAERQRGRVAETVTGRKRLPAGDGGVVTAGEGASMLAFRRS